MIKFKNSLESINFQEIKKIRKQILVLLKKAKRQVIFFGLALLMSGKVNLTKKIIKEINQKFNYEMKYLGYL